jgi:hypothetical protein
MMKRKEKVKIKDKENYKGSAKETENGKEDCRKASEKE